MSQISSLVNRLKKRFGGRILIEKGPQDHLQENEGRRPGPREVLDSNPEARKAPSDLLGISAVGWPFRIVLPCSKGFYITAN